MLLAVQGPGATSCQSYRHQLLDGVEASVFVSPGAATYLTIFLADHNVEFVKNTELGVLGMNANVETFPSDSSYPSHAHTSKMLDRDAALETAVRPDHECTHRARVASIHELADCRTARIFVPMVVPKHKNAVVKPMCGAVCVPYFGLRCNIE